MSEERRAKSEERSDLYYRIGAPLINLSIRQCYDPLRMNAFIHK